MVSAPLPQVQWTDQVVPLLALPAGAGGRVFQHDATGLEVGPDLIRKGEISPTARNAAILDEPLDLVDGNWGRSIFLTP